MNQESETYRTWTKWLAGATLGAAAMYLADPDRGKRRRALARDKMQSIVVRTGDAIDVASRDLANRMHGLRARARRVLSNRSKAVDDQTVAARVRAKIGRMVSHPHAIKVMVHQGQVMLNGPVLANEKEQLLHALHTVPGVTTVEDRLQIYEQADNIARLYGENQPRYARSTVMRENWPPALRAIAVVSGGALGFYAMTRRTPASAVLALLGFGLLARGTVNRPLMRTTEATGRQAIDLHKTIHIAASPEAVFDLWSNVENFPHFMSNVREVRKQDNGRSHWVVSGPAGIPVEWDAVLTDSVRPQRLAWHTAADAPVQHTGTVRFDPEDGGTRVSVHLSYSPPAGVIGHAVASLFGGNPKREMDEDLMRMKTFAERGIPPRDAAQPEAARPAQQPGATLH